MKSKRLDEIKNRVDWFSKTEDASRALLNELPNGELAVGICNLALGFESSTFEESLLTIRKLKNPPGIIHIARAANLNRSDYLSVGRYSSHLQAELVAGKPDSGMDRNALLQLAWHWLALLKLRGFQRILCPVMASCSWDAICAINNNSVIFGMLDDVPRYLQYAKLDPPVEMADMRWIEKFNLEALRLREVGVSRRFGLAFNVAYSWNHTTDARMALSNIWTGIEALFGDKKDRPVTRNLLDRLGAWLALPDSSSLNELYNLRCDAVHGREISDVDTPELLQKTYVLLSSSLIKCIETGSVPLPDWN